MVLLLQVGWQEARVSQELQGVGERVGLREVGERVERVGCREHQEVQEEAVALLLMALRGARERAGQMGRMGAREQMERRGRVVRLRVADCPEGRVGQTEVEGHLLQVEARGRVGQVVYQD